MHPDDIIFYRSKGLHYNPGTHNFEVYVFDEVVKEVSFELVKDVRRIGKLDSLILDIKKNVAYDLGRRLFRLDEKATGNY